MRPALELPEVQLETLFEFDPRGRMTGQHAPRMFLGRTLEGQLLGLRADLSDAMAAELSAVAAHEPAIADLREPPPPAGDFRAALGAIQTEYRGPAFWLPAECDDPRAAEAGVETQEPARERGHARRVVAAWAAQVRAAGLRPLYSTWWENSASLALAASLGAVAYAEDFHLT